ncbi:MAG: gamma-glutamyl-gamma-aminobutyrate hydrolase family protein [Capsulimonadaceae bacterium]
MNKPIILITVERINLAAKADEVQMVLAGCPLDYPRAVEAAGGVPLLLPPSITSRATLEAAARSAQGVLLTGGGDVAPLTYGADPLPPVGLTDPERDAIEIDLVSLAETLGRPLLGICRGLQLINVALGGTLIQDIPTQVPGAIQHRGRALDKTPIHAARIEPGTKLEAVLETSELHVNSNHHQAAADVARGLRVSATARDGVIEGLEAVGDGRRILAVQWHPEETAARDRASAALFRWLIAEALS